jgi:glycine dehydrogenase subunit 2
VALSAALAPFLPLPYTIVDAHSIGYVEHAGRPAQPVADRSMVSSLSAAQADRSGDAGSAGGVAPPAAPQAADRADAGAKPLGRMCAFHGQMGMYVRAYAYMLSHGSDGMRQASEDAVLNANYVRSALADVMSAPFGDQLCMHEALFDDRWLEGTGITTLDFAKAMIDEGYHPMTIYFPLVVHGAMLIEPTESESKESLDRFIASLRKLATAARGGELARFREAPRFAPRRRLDETKAAREPRLRWTAAQERQEAAE